MAKHFNFSKIDELDWLPVEKKLDWRKKYYDLKRAVKWYLKVNGGRYRSTSAASLCEERADALTNLKMELNG